MNLCKQIYKCIFSKNSKETGPQTQKFHSCDFIKGYAPIKYTEHVLIFLKGKNFKLIAVGKGNLYRNI